MTAAERRQAIAHVLSLRGFETMSNLAMEFHVSERTVRRDVEALSLSEPLYTQAGRYGGGVYMMRGHKPNRPAVGEAEAIALCRILDGMEKGDISALDENDRAALRRVILACRSSASDLSSI